MKKRFLACLAVLLTIAGCAGIPRSGPVQNVTPAATAGAPIGLAAQPPADGATPEAIVEGFLVASQAGLDDDFSVARQYLYADAATSWKPLAEVRIFPDAQDIAISTTDSGSVRASVGTLGTLASGGTFVEAPNDAVSTTEFSLARNEAGQWRIVSLDDGMFLSEHLFSSMFTEAPVYFLSANSKVLVPDLHYFPTRSFATSAVNGLLRGPSSWLAAGVHTAIPTGTELVESVQVTDSKATVNLTNDALSASGEQQKAMIAQITQTLTTVSTIRSVEIQIEGSPITAERPDTITTYPYGSYPVSVLADGIPGTISDGEIVHHWDGPDLSELGLTDLAVSYLSDQSSYVALGTDRTELVVVNTALAEWAVLARGTRYVSPSYDTYGWVVTGEQSNDGSLLVAQPSTGVTHILSAEWLTGVTIRDIKVSRDGSRVLVVGAVGGNTTMQIASIGRDSSGVPQSIGDPITLGQLLVDADDAVWIGATTIAVIGKTSAGSDRALYSVRVGGMSSRLSNVYAGTVEITAGREQSSIVTLTDEGVAYVREGSAWRSIATGVTSVAMPG